MAEPIGSQGGGTIVSERDALPVLLRVQKIDEEIRALEGVTRAIPVEIEGLRGDLEAQGRACEEKRARLKELKVKEREKEGRVRDYDGQIDRHKQQLLQIKNNVAYQVMLKEIEKIREEKDRVEDEGLELIGTIEAVETELRDLEGEHETRETEFKAREAVLLAQKGEAEARLEVLRGRRAREIPQVPEGLRTRYQRIRDNKEGLAVVPLKDNVCGSCFSMIPVQRVNEIKHENDLKSCDSCGRIVYYLDEDHGG